MARAPDDRKAIEEALDELEINLKRLRIEYEQFFRGAMKREPMALRGKIQKVISQFMQTPPRAAAHKFRFNSLNARYQSFRQLWGRTMREMENGSYKQHQFKLKLQAEEEEREVRELQALEREHAALDERRARPSPASPERATRPAGGGAASPIDRLADALRNARSKTGEAGTPITRDRLAAIVRKQTEAIRAKRGNDVKVKFKVVIEDNRAKLKATVE